MKQRQLVILQTQYHCDILKNMKKIVASQTNA